MTKTEDLKNKKNLENTEEYSKEKKQTIKEIYSQKDKKIMQIIATESFLVYIFKKALC